MPRAAAELDISEKALEHLEDFKNSSHLSAPIKEFYTCLIELCAKEAPNRVSRTTLIKTLKSKEISCSQPIITRRINYLKEIGAATEFFGHLKGTHCQIVTIHSLLPLIDGARSEPVKPIGRPTQQVLLFDEDRLPEGSTFVDLALQTPARIESLFSILDAAMRLSGHDPRKVISCKYFFDKDDYITIKATTSSEEKAGVTCLADMRVMRALNSIILESIEYKYGRSDTYTADTIRLILEKERYFYFDICDLCRRMGLRASLINRRQVAKILLRLRDTAFEVDATRSHLFKTRFSLNADIDHYRYITEFKAQNDDFADQVSGPEKATTRHYSIKIHEMILANLLTTGRSFISHDQLMSDKSGIAQRLNNWCKAVIGVRPRYSGDSDNGRHVYTLKEFHERVLPSSLFANFRRDLISLIKRQCDKKASAESDFDGGTFTVDAASADLATSWAGEGNTSVAWLYGYYIQVEWDEHKYEMISRRRGRRVKLGKRTHPIVITVWRDTKDQLVGDNSNHNQAIRRQAVELIEGSSHAAGHYGT